LQELLLLLVASELSSVVAVMNINGHCVGLGHVDDLLHIVGLVYDLIDVLNDLHRDLHVSDHGNLDGDIDVLGDVNVLVDDLDLLHGVGPVDVNNLDSGHLPDLLDLNNLGHVPDDIVGLIDVLVDRHVSNLFDLLSLDLGHMTDEFPLYLLHGHLGYVSDDLLHLGNLDDTVVSDNLDGLLVHDLLRLLVHDLLLRLLVDNLLLLAPDHRLLLHLDDVSAMVFAIDHAISSVQCHGRVVATSCVATPRGLRGSPLRTVNGLGTLDNVRSVKPAVDHSVSCVQRMG